MSWQQEFSDAIKTIEVANTFFNCHFSKTNYPLFIPKKFAKKILNSGADSPLWRQFLPQESENQNTPLGMYDPIGDKLHSKGNQIIHRYKNRILFMPTSVCPIACRYCFRKNELSNKDEMFDPHFNDALNYLQDHSEVNEVIFSGGDPLILSNEKIASYLEAFSQIKSIKYIRFHSRTPIILPERIDEGLVSIFKNYSQKFTRLMLMIHINHLDEIDSEIETAIAKLTENHIELFSQTVLLKGINDATEILKELFIKLAELKITPYYLHHPDQVLGAMHFYMPLEAGRKIFAPLHDQLPGWALPQYMIDVPGGEGKIPAFNPEGFEFSGKLLNRNGEIKDLQSTF
jgi:lysine 2,3-aminomutase